MNTLNLEIAGGFLAIRKMEQLGNKKRVIQIQTGLVPADEGSYMM